ncbi:hypothetical protein Leryth_015725 [Lithospermum erythrorhizon]|nr:hypothetical protein Leryth_015725 [Lithospermum erythrorhizon]
MIIAWILYRHSVKAFGQHSLRSAACYVFPLIPSLMYAAYFGGFLIAFLSEKMGATGSHPPPYGLFIPDMIVAVSIGAASGWCVGPLLPVVGRWLTKNPILQFLLHSSIIAMALSAQFFPYSTEAPKRVILQHTVFVADGGQILESSYDFSVVDSNSLIFVFKNAPDVAKELDVNPELSLDDFNQSHVENWVGIYPISILFSRSLKFPASSEKVLQKYKYLPHLSTVKQIDNSGGQLRRTYLELSLGSLQEVWVAVLNVTGPLSSWSFADEMLPAPEVVGHGPASYICRLSGASHENWTFWLEANSSEAIRVELAVVEQHLTEPVTKLKGLFPSWMDVTAYASFRSTHFF